MSELNGTMKHDVDGNNEFHVLAKSPLPPQNDLSWGDIMWQADRVIPKASYVM